MTLNRGRLVFLLVLVLLGAGAVLLFLSVPSVVKAPAPVPKPEPPPYLGFPAALSGTLRVGETDFFRLRLKQGDALSMALRSAREDITLRLLDPSGIELIWMNSAHGLRDLEMLYTLAKTAGDYVLEIRSGAPGRTVQYQLEISEPHPASDPDRFRAAAMSWFSQGERLLADKENKQAGRQAAASYLKALDEWGRSGELERATATRFRLALALQREKGWRPSDAVLRAVLSEVQARPSLIAEARVLDRLGRARFYLGELEEAQRFFEQSLDLFQRESYQPGLADLFGNLGVVRRRRGDFQQGLKYDRDSLDLWESLGVQEEEATLLNNLGELYLLDGQLEQALDYFERSLDVAARARLPEKEAMALRGKGTVLGQQKKVDLALDSLKKSIAISERVGSRHDEVVTRVRLGDIFALSGRFAEAQAIYEHALRVAEEEEDLSGRAMALGNLGRLMHLQGDARKGLIYFSQAWEIFEKIDPTPLGKIALGKAQALRDLGELEEARVAAKDAIDRFEAFQGPYLRVIAASDRRASYELYVNILMRLGEQTKRAEYEAQAFEAAEEERFRTLLDDVGESLSHSQVSNPALVRKKESLENQLNKLELARWILPVDSSKIKQLDRDVRELETGLAIVRRDLQVRPARSASKPLSLAQVQKSLEPGSLLLVYFLSEEGSYLWEVGRDRFRTHSLDKRAAIEKVAKKVKEKLSQPLPSQHWRTWASPLRDLSRLVLSPVADDLGQQKLIIDPDGALNVIPFAALLDPRTLERKGVPGDGSEGPRFLAFDHETVVVPSVSLVTARRRVLEGRPQAPGAIAVLSDPVFGRSDERFPEGLRMQAHGAEFPRLRRTAEEADAILAEVPGNQSFDARGFGANRATATSPELRRYRILHFATHGWLRDRPDLSGIVLSLVDESGKTQDGFLRAFEIYDLDLRSDLVVLSACDTGLGSDQGGLVRGFLNSGARQVVATLWPVKDRWTARLMASFYRSHLRQGLSTSAALRQAQLDLVSGSRSLSPYYWAGFVLHGDWLALTVSSKQKSASRVLSNERRSAEPAHRAAPLP